MKALFVCHDPPAPPNNGGSIDMLGMLDSLARLGFDVDLLMTPRTLDAEADTARLAQSARRIIPVARNLGLRAALAARPFQIASRRGLQTVALNAAYDLVVASDHCGNVFDNPTLHARWRVLRRNNDEALYARRMARDATSQARTLFFRKEAFLFARWTRRQERKVDQIWYVSTAELDRERHGPPPSALSRVLVPSALGDLGVVPARRDAIAGGRILYFGSLTVPVNRRAVDWFVANVYPRLRADRDVQLIVAGRIGPGEAEWAAQLAARDDLTFLPNPSSADDVYAPGGIFIDPLAHDAGIKLKILEATRHGYAVACHPDSLLGSGLELDLHARVTANPAVMAREIIGLMTDPDAAVAMVGRAQARLLEHFDIDRNIRQALAISPLRCAS